MKPAFIVSTLGKGAEAVAGVNVEFVGTSPSFGSSIANLLNAPA
ncbi:MAG: hypothetical protein ABIR96_00645 [Bdellovibrionota bacterium]